MLQAVLDPTLHKLMEVKSVVDDFTGTTMTNLQLLCHFNSNLPVVKN
jgi:hypothetical protein